MARLSDWVLVGDWLDSAGLYAAMSEEKIGLRFVRQYDITVDQAPRRLDCYYGMPESWPSYLPWYSLWPRVSWLWRHRAMSAWRVGWSELTRPIFGWRVKYYR